MSATGVTSSDATAAAAGQEDFAFDAVERLAGLSGAEVDALPYGFMVLDRDGVIELYNRYESAMSRLDPARVVGRNFFRHVAPCTRVQAFEGRFRALLEDPARRTDRFAFRFNFAHGAQDVLVQLAASPDRDRVFVTVVRRAVAAPDVGVSGPHALAADRETGEASGPFGLTLGLPLGALGAALGALAPEALAELGRACGVALAAAARRHAAREGRALETDGDAVWALGVLDAVWAGAGLGRLAGDPTARGRGALELLVRPPGWTSTAVVARLYEHALAELAGAIDPRGALGAVCLDLRDPAVVPWRFIADEPAACAALAARRDAGEPPSALHPWGPTES